MNFQFFHRPLSLLQTFLILVCIFFVFSMLCFGVSPLLFSVNCCKVFNGMSSHDENCVLLWHIVSISIVKILNKNTPWHRTRQWKVEPKTDKKVYVTLSCFETFIAVMNSNSYTIVGNKMGNLHENIGCLESIPLGIVPPIFSLH